MAKCSVNSKFKNEDVKGNKGLPVGAGQEFVLNIFPDPVPLTSAVCQTFKSSVNGFSSALSQSFSEITRLSEVTQQTLTLIGRPCLVM